MSYVSYMEKLLDGVGVEWKTLGEVAKIQRGASPRPIQNFITNDDNGVPWIKIGDTSSDSKYVNKTAQKITLEGAEKSRVLKKGDFILSNSMSYGRPYILNIDGAIHDGWASISDFESQLNSDFLYYYLSSKIVQNYWDSKINSSSVSNLNADIIKTLQIPIPPLPIQAEIVRILDAFTALTAELTAELTARKKQYNYYRDLLLTSSNSPLAGGEPISSNLALLGAEANLPPDKGGMRGDVEWKTLGEVGELIRGGGLQKKDFTETGVGCIHYGQIYTYYGTYADKTKTYVSEEFFKKARKAKSGDLVIATTSENDEDVCKAVAWLGHEEIAVSSDACIYRHNLNPKYVSYFFKTEQFQKQKRQYITGTKVRRVNADDLAKIQIPIPPLTEQTHIVAILDKFDALTNSITEGLPREIKLRQQQYAYYRDLLLSFAKP